MLSNYAWEESGFPPEWIREFNTTLNLITVTSSYVAKVLRDNGVRVPVRVVGNGVDPTLGTRGLPPDAQTRRGSFRFLHVSSGFPRKGLDVLLSAWSDTFTRDDAVELVIKTFPNPHNQIEAELRSFYMNHPNGAPISLINEVLPADDLHELYLSADALVCPSRGEGFGLPMAEALALAKAVITTAYGGQSDFCTADTAWLCDYTFAYAKSHIDVFELGLGRARSFIT